MYKEFFFPVQTHWHTHFMPLKKVNWVAPAHWVKKWLQNKYQQRDITNGHETKPQFLFSCQGFILHTTCVSNTYCLREGKKNHNDTRLQWACFQLELQILFIIRLRIYAEHHVVGYLSSRYFSPLNIFFLFCSLMVIFSWFRVNAFEFDSARAT